MIWAKTAAEAIERLKNKDWDVVSLDHDLGVEWLEDSREKNSGMEVVRYLTGKDCNPDKFADTKFIIHSWNPIAIPMMWWKLRRRGYSVRIRPFSY
jgi:hypothetical protein